MVEGRGSGHRGRRNADLVDAELAQLLDRGAPNHTTHSGPDHGTHTHRARLAGGIKDRLTPAEIAVARDMVVDCDDLAMKGRVGGAFIDAGGHDLTIRCLHYDGAERENRIA